MDLYEFGQCHSEQSSNACPCNGNGLSDSISTFVGMESPDL